MSFTYSSSTLKVVFALEDPTYLWDLSRLIWFTLGDSRLDLIQRKCFVKLLYLIRWMNLHLDRQNFSSRNWRKDYFFIQNPLWIKLFIYHELSCSDKNDFWIRCFSPHQLFQVWNSLQLLNTSDLDRFYSDQNHNSGHALRVNHQKMPRD